MMKNIIIIITIMLCFVTFCSIAQNNIICGHEINIQSKKVVIDYLKFDSIPNFILQNIELFKYAKCCADIKNNSVIITTKMFVIIDNDILATKQEKRNTLSGIRAADIVEIQILDAKSTTECYNLKNKYGSMIIKTKDQF